MRPAIWLDGGALSSPRETLPSANAPGHSARRGGRRRCRRPLFGMRRRLSRGAPRLAWNRAGHLPTACDQVSNRGGDPRCRPPCVVVISFDGTRRLPSWRFRPASKAVCLEPCRRGCGSGVMARRCGNLFWVTSPDLPIRVSSVRRVWIGAHGFLYKTDAVGLCRRVGRS